jgi:hypothetical protein
MNDSKTVPAPTQYRLTAPAIVIKIDADTDPTTAATLSLIAAIWIELGEEQEWLSADWWC